MNPDKIRFNCPTCGIQLDVPVALAGVTGPCPSCQSSITAPHPQIDTPAAPAPQPAPQPAPTAPAPQQPTFPSQPAEAAPRQPEPHQEPVPLPTYQEIPAPRQPIPETPQPLAESKPSAGENVFPTLVPHPSPAEVHPIPDETPFPIEPSPMKGLPEQRSSDGLASHQHEEPVTHTSGKAPSATKQSSRIPSLLFLLAAIIVMTVGVLLVLNYTGVVGLNSLKSLFGGRKAQPTAPAIAPSLTPSAPATQENSSLEVESDTPPPTEELPPTQIVEPTATAPEEEAKPAPQLPEGQNYREGETPLPEGLHSITNDPREIQKILASFLSAKNLSERESFLSAESATSPEIANSPLAGPIAEPISTLFMDVITDQEEERMDFFYVVAWNGEDSTPAKPMAVELHKWPGSEPPRVHSEAFLEFYQQKLARYAANPLDRPARFYVLGQCVAKCFETEDVADHATKATLKLGTFPNDRNPVKAYFDKKGEILEQLKAYRNGLSFRKGIPMTVTLAWSDPLPGSTARHLEVRLIDSFDWHP